jgi:hypothetical protein
MRASRSIWIVLATVSLACATAALPPSRDLESGDLTKLVGRWEGSFLTSQGRRMAVAWAIREDGTFVTTSGAGRTDGRLWIRDGKVVFEGAFADGVLALHEGDGHRILRGPATLRGYGGSGEGQAELRQVR